MSTTSDAVVAASIGMGRGGRFVGLAVAGAAAFWLVAAWSSAAKTAKCGQLTKGTFTFDVPL